MGFDSGGMVKRSGVQILFERNLHRAFTSEEFLCCDFDFGLIIFRTSKVMDRRTGGRENCD